MSTLVPERGASLRLLIWTPLAAAGLLAALITGRPELVVLAGPFAVTLVAGVALVSRPEFTCRVDMDADRVLQGDVVQAEVHLTSSVNLPRVEVLLGVPSGLSVVAPPEERDNSAPSVLWRERRDTGASIGVALPSGPAGTGRSLRWRLRADRWGAYRVGPVTLRAHDPSGLLVWTVTGEQQQRLRALPSAGTLAALVQPHQTLVTAGNVVDRTKGEGIEFADVRPFRVGDRPRAVNWRSTARRGALWVNERHNERNADIVLFLDSFVDKEMAAAPGLDRSVRAACSLAAAYLRHRDRIGVIDLGGLRWLTPAMGEAALYRVIDVLVSATPLQTEADRPLRLFPQYLLPARALVIALTPLLDERIDEALFELRRRRVDLVVIEVDPEEGVVEPPGPLGPLARRLWRLERDRRRHVLEGLGAVVIRWRQSEPLAHVMREVDRSRHRVAP
jgi:uncharacterized protein (DUF58 family)